MRNECEILFPNRERMLSTLHFTHYSHETMMKQALGRIFWPSLRDDLKAKYENCAECQGNKNSKAEANNEVSQENMFDNLHPDHRVQVDFAVKGCQNYMTSCEEGGKWYNWMKRNCRSTCVFCYNRKPLYKD